MTKKKQTKEKNDLNLYQNKQTNKNIKMAKKTLNCHNQILIPVTK